jgi:hypothetical protein
MSSIFRRALGIDFQRLHPKVRERFGVGLTEGYACVGTGVMDQIWHGSPLVRPFLHLGAGRHILFPETGADVPFTIENWPYIDRAGREAVSFTRTFELPGVRRRFDATMVFDGDHQRLVDYLGTHQHIAAELRFGVDDRGGMVIRTGEQRIRFRRLDRAIPELVAGHARVCEWFDPGDGMFHIDVRVENRWFGPLFGYRGRFTARYVDLNRAPAPASVLPAKEETRTLPTHGHSRHASPVDRRRVGRGA